MRTKQILLFGLVTCSLTGNMACKDADREKTLCIDNVRMISRVTGDPLPGDTLLNPNNTGPDFDVYGTDLGLMWHMDGNRVGMFFGDTSGEGFVVNKNGGNGSNWRSNVLAFSSDTELTDGLKIDSMLLMPMVRRLRYVRAVRRIRRYTRLPSLRVLFGPVKRIVSIL